MINKKIFFFLVGLAIFACKAKEPLTIIGETNTNVQIIDTFGIDLSTILVDSLPTSSSQRLLVGKLVNLGAGNVNAISYFQISLKGTDADGDGFEDILQFTNTPIYDSIILVLNHNYSYGDTTSTHSMSIYRVNESMASGSTLYNSSFFNYDAAALGGSTCDFRTTNELHITLSDQLGNELFSLAKDRDFKVANNANFKDYFKGLVMVPNTANKSMFGYEPTAVVRLYYHDIETPEVQQYYDFSLKTDNSQDTYFNRITSDRSSTKLSSLKEIYQEIASEETNNESYLLTGVELIPKIKFPTVNDIKTQFPFSGINKAELIIHPKLGTYNSEFYPANRLALYSTDNTNVPKSLITYSNTVDVEVISPAVDWESQELTYYTFDVTDFIVNKTDNLNTELALMLASIQQESSGRVEKLVLSNNRNSNFDIKLKIYLTSFK